MFNLGSQAAAVFAKLKAGVPALQTVAYLDEAAQSSDYSVAMPCAFVALEKVGGSAGKLVSLSSDATWVVIVRGRRLEGADGLLAVIDAVVCALHGFNPGVGSGSLRFAGVDYYKDVAQSVSYAVRFEAGVVGTTENRPCEG